MAHTSRWFDLAYFGGLLALGLLTAFLFGVVYGEMRADRQAVRAYIETIPEMTRAAQGITSAARRVGREAEAIWREPPPCRMTANTSPKE